MRLEILGSPHPPESAQATGEVESLLLDLGLFMKEFMNELEQKLKDRFIRVWKENLCSCLEEEEEVMPSAVSWHRGQLRAGQRATQEDE